MLDDLKHYTKYAGMWLTARGVVTLAVLGATMGLGVGGATIPLLTLPIGLGAAIYMNNDRGNYLKTRVKNAYKLELAATLDKDPTRVTVDDLERVAYGDARAGLPGNGILKEQLECIAAHRRVSLFANIGAVGVAVATFGVILGGGFGDFLQTWQNFLEPLSSRLPLVNPEVFAAGTLASGITMAADYGLETLGKTVARLENRTTYDVIQDIKKDRYNGEAVAPEQVLEVFVRRDPALADTVRREYGSAYQDLPREEQTLVLHGLAQKEMVIHLTQKINEGRVSPNELTFLAEAQHSGLPEREPRHRALFLPGMFAARQAAPEPAAPEQSIGEKSPAAEPPAPAAAPPAAPTPATRNSSSFVERYIAHAGNGKEAKSFVEKLALQQEARQDMGAERS